MAHHLILPATTIFLILLSLSPSTIATSAVVDIDGNPLEAGSKYYVLTSGTRGAGRGGLTDESKPPKLCPKYVGQLQFWQDQGKPVSFYPADPSQKEITEGVDVNIAFFSPSYCRDQGVWRIEFDEGTMVPYVSTNGVIGNPEDADTFANWFKIEKAFGPQSYKIVYCFLRPVPAPGSGVRTTEENCQQLDATQPGFNGLSWLSLVPIDNPLPFFGFVFKKATTSSS